MNCLSSFRYINLLPCPYIYPPKLLLFLNMAVAFSKTATELNNSMPSLIWCTLNENTIELRAIERFITNGLFFCHTKRDFTARPYNNMAVAPCSQKKIYNDFGEFLPASNLPLIVLLFMMSLI